MAELVGRSLLLNSNNSVRPPDEALFMNKLVGDGDTTALKKSAAAQRDIVGEEAADGNQFIARDWNHFLKLIGTDLRKLSTNAGYSGKVGVTPERIERIEADVKQICERYKRRAIDDDDITAEEKAKYVDILLIELGSVIRHHAGDHSSCTHDMCRYTQLLEDHPDWDKARLIKEHDDKNAFGGEILQVGEDGIKELTSIITKRINKQNADAICMMESSTPVEHMNGLVIKYTNAKRKNLTQTDGYDAILGSSNRPQVVGKRVQLPQL